MFFGYHNIFSTFSKMKYCMHKSCKSWEDFCLLENWYWSSFVLKKYWKNKGWYLKTVRKYFICFIRVFRKTVFLCTRTATMKEALNFSQHLCFHNWDPLLSSLSEKSINYCTPTSGGKVMYDYNFQVVFCKLELFSRKKTHSVTLRKLLICFVTKSLSNFLQVFDNRKQGQH